MGPRYHKTKKLMPAGMLALSAIVAGAYDCSKILERFEVEEEEVKVSEDEAKR